MAERIERYAAAAADGSTVTGDRARGRPPRGRPRPGGDRLRRLPGRDRAGRRGGGPRHRAHRDRHGRRRRARQAAPRGVPARARRGSASRPRRRSRSRTPRPGSPRRRPRACAASPSAAPCPTSASRRPTSWSTGSTSLSSGGSSARPVILAIDQGTTGTTCLVVDESLRPVGRGYREIAQHFPEPGWVEHDPEEIWASVLVTAAGRARGRRSRGIATSAAIGITNQRETTVVWERRSGRPVQHAIVWQDRRTAARCAELPAALVRERTGLVCDPYFSATKLEWILARTELPQSALAFGTIDSWLVWKLTRRRRTRHRRDERLAHDAPRPRDRCMGRRAPRSLRRRPRHPAGRRSVVRRRRRGDAPRRDAPRGRHRGRPAGSALRPGLLRPGSGEGDLRHRHVRPRERRPTRRAPWRTGC